MKLNRRLVFLSGLLALLVSSCNNNKDSSTATFIASDIVEAATEQASAIGQMLSPEGATSCTSGGSTTALCAGVPPYVLNHFYTGCTLSTSSSPAMKVNGNIDFTYSTSDCSIAGANVTLLREEKLSVQTAGGRTLFISSQASKDYRGNLIGGGRRVTKAGDANAFTVDILGLQRIVVNVADVTTANLTTRTTTAIQGTGTSLSNLVLSSGTVELVHNQYRYVTTLNLSNVSFAAGCACPVSGSLTGKAAGKVSADLSITYLSCGKASIVVGTGLPQEVNIPNCQFP